MPDRTTQKTIDKFEALLDMIAEDGETPAGQLPSKANIEALRNVDDIDREKVKNIKQQHSQGKSQSNGNK